MVGKVAVAFLAGVVLALGGAVFFSRQLETVQAHPPIATNLTVPAKPVTAPDVVTPPAEPAQVPETKVEEPIPAPKQAAPANRSTIRARKAREVRPTSDAVPVAAPILRDETLVSQLRPEAQPQRPLDLQPTAMPPQQTQAIAPAPPQPAAPSAAPVREPHVVTLPAGTVLNVRLGETLTSERNTSGDTFRGTLDAPILADGFIIADRRSPVVGRVVQANDAGRVKGVANLVLAISELNTTDGQRVPIQTDSYEKWGNSSKKQDTAKIAGGAALGAIIGAIAGGGKGAAIGAGAGGAAGTGVVFGTKGGPAAVSSETVLTFRLASPVTLTEKFN